jgi:hypothetical protein
MTVAVSFGARLRALGNRIAANRMAVARARLVGRWQGEGVRVVDSGQEITLAARNLRERRLGSRTALADPAFVWPGEDP